MQFPEGLEDTPLKSEKTQKCSDESVTNLLNNTFAICSTLIIISAAHFAILTFVLNGWNRVWFIGTNSKINYLIKYN